jgi:hypothetical protein
MEKKVEAGQFVVSLWRSNDHPGGLDWLDTCIEMVIKHDAKIRAEALKEARIRVMEAWHTTEAWKDDLSLAVVCAAILAGEVKE